MVTGKKVYGRAVSMPVGIGIGTAVSLVILIAGVAVLAALLDRETMDMQGLGYGIMGVLLLASFLGASLAANLVKRRRLVVCMIQAVCFYGMLLLINGLLFGGAVTGAVVTAVLILGGAGSGALLWNGGEGKRRSAIRKRRTG